MGATLSWAWQNPWVRVVVYVGLAGLAFLLLSWVMNGARTAVNIVLVALVFSYVVGPVVRWFEMRHRPAGYLGLPGRPRRPHEPKDGSLRQPAQRKWRRLGPGFRGHQSRKQAAR